MRAHCPDGAVWSYAYDPFGRRISKECAAEHRRFIWDGDVVALEAITLDGVFSEIAWFFEPDSFRPMARVEAGKLLHIVNDHLGTPKEAVDGKGRLVWSADHDTWGTLRRVKTWRHERAALQPTGQFGGVAMRAVTAEPDALLIPIRFQGQWEDAETGLYYNRFRYYEPGAGRYLSADPIGLLGDVRNYGYTENATFWADPLGLGPCRCCGWGSFEGEVGNSLFTPDDPAKLGLPPGAQVPFHNGTPNFGAFTQSVAGLPGEFSVPGLTGNHSQDRGRILKYMAQQAGLPRGQIESLIGKSGMNLRLHHVGGDRIQIVPEATHKLPHNGGAADLRNGC